MAEFKPVVMTSQMYDWEADNSVYEVLVFFDPSIDTEIEKPHLKAEMKLRAVKTGNGTFKALIRRGGINRGLMHEYDFTFSNEYGAMRFLINWLEGCFEVRNSTFTNVPNKRED